LRERSYRTDKKQMVAAIVALYCRKKHGSKRGELCPDCAALQAFSLERAERCPHREARQFCSGCPTPCYGSKREDMRRIMRYAAPRLIFSRPGMVLRHAVQTIIQRRKKRYEKAD
jgi:hypothetical protein